MMEFRTKVELPKGEAEIHHEDRILVMGSCFSEHIGQRLQQEKFCCMVNPYGVLYNPASIAEALREIASDRKYVAASLRKGDDGLWHSMMHHGSFSMPDRKECLRKINERLHEAHRFLLEADWLLVTLGTSFVYSLSSNPRRVVGNCHHFPASMFRRERLGLIGTSIYCSMILDAVRQVNPRLKVLFTVSPVRHRKDGLHANQLSKADLLTAIDQVQHQHDGVFYFPAYELMMDELRDYRFYADDMLHPSSLAVDYIWQQFADSYFSKKTQAILKEWDAVRRALDHRPLHPDTEEYRTFVSQTLLKLQQLQEKFPYFGLEKEIAQCEDQLKTP